jgi:hypothetical protein
MMRDECSRAGSAHKLTDEVIAYYYARRLREQDPVLGRRSSLM